MIVTLTAVPAFFAPVATPLCRLCARRRDLRRARPRRPHRPLGPLRYEAHGGHHLRGHQLRDSDVRIVLDQALASKHQVGERAQRGNRRPEDVVAVRGSQLRHVLKVHAVDAGQELHRDDQRGNDRQREQRLVGLRRLVHLDARYDVTAPLVVHVAELRQRLRLSLHHGHEALEPRVLEELQRILLQYLRQTPGPQCEPAHAPQLGPHLIGGYVVPQPGFHDERVREEFEIIAEFLRQWEGVLHELVREHRQQEGGVRVGVVARAGSLHQLLAQPVEVGPRAGVLAHREDEPAVGDEEHGHLLVAHHRYVALGVVPVQQLHGEVHVRAEEPQPRLAVPLEEQGDRVVALPRRLTSSVDEPQLHLNEKLADDRVVDALNVEPRDDVRTRRRVRDLIKQGEHLLVRLGLDEPPRGVPEVGVFAVVHLGIGLRLDVGVLVVEVIDRELGERVELLLLLRLGPRDLLGLGLGGREQSLLLRRDRGGCALRGAGGLLRQ